MEGRCVFGVVHSGVAEVVEVAADEGKMCLSCCTQWCGRGG